MVSSSVRSVVVIVVVIIIIVHSSGLFLAQGARCVSVLACKPLKVAASLGPLPDESTLSTAKRESICD